MNEAEAKTKWCPFAKSRVVEARTPAGFTVKSYQDIPDSPPENFSSKCLGSRCMAWRWNNSSYDPNDKLDQYTVSIGHTTAKKLGFSKDNPPKFSDFPPPPFIAPYNEGWEPDGEIYKSKRGWSIDVKRDASHDIDEDEHGYCGLAGKP